MKRLQSMVCLAIPLVLTVGAAQASCRAMDAVNGVVIPDWVAQYQACPDSPLATYNAVLTWWNRGDRQEALDTLAEGAKRHKDFEPLQRLQKVLTQATKNPYQAAADLAVMQFNAWLDAYEMPVFTLTPPPAPGLPPLPQLVKDEFETTPQFKERVEAAKRERAETIKRLEKEYASAVAEYNAVVEAHNKAMEEALARRNREAPAMREQVLGESLGFVMGRPRLTDAKYDADQQKFYARLVAAAGNFDQPVMLDVPLAQALAFKSALDTVDVDVEFAVTGQRIDIKTIHARQGSATYLAHLTDQAAPAPTVAVKLQDAVPVDFGRLGTLSTARATLGNATDSSYFDEALKLEANPELAKLKQQETENARKLAERRRQEQEAAELAEARRRIEEQQRQLALSGDPQFKGLVPVTQWKFTQSRVPKHDAVAVIIGNRKYGDGVPMVHWARADAAAMKQFFAEGLQLDPANILYAEDATKGKMEGLFKSTLPNRVVKGQTDVYVYYSGHGMVTPEQKAMLLPVDASGETAAVTGYGRDTLMTQLAALDARSVTVILDACYSGTAKSGEALVAGKPVFNAPTGMHVPKGITLVSAASSRQIAWTDDKVGHSLLTYHLLKGLNRDADKNRDGHVETAELADYLKREVDRSARTLHEQPQQPEIIGGGAEWVVY